MPGDLGGGHIMLPQEKNLFQGYVKQKQHDTYSGRIPDDIIENHFMLDGKHHQRQKEYVHDDDRHQGSSDYQP